MLGRVLLGLLVGGTCVLHAQQQQSAPIARYTDILLGVGHTGDEAAWSLGFEHRPKDSRVAWRVLLEQWDHHAVLPGPEQHDFQVRRFLGAQLLGLRLFRQRHRAQPYVLAGLAVYRRSTIYGFSSYEADAEGNLVRGPLTTGYAERTHPFMLWGTGLNVRVSGVNLFGELKLPMPMGHRGGNFDAAPLVFGVRF